METADFNTRGGDDDQVSKTKRGNVKWDAGVDPTNSNPWHTKIWTQTPEQASGTDDSSAAGTALTYLWDLDAEIQL